jgi:RNA-directed DNA polymerase
MSGKRQKTHYSRASEPKGRSETPAVGRPRVEPLAANPAPESPVVTEQLMEEVCGGENLQSAWRRVRGNQGSPGVDGMTINDVRGYLREHWPNIRCQLLDGTYRPQPVKRVEIPKPDGGVRKLGVPCVVDRLIQQAVLQVLQERWDATFSEHSFGFRPARSAHQAVAQAQRYVAEEHAFVGYPPGDPGHEAIMVDSIEYLDAATASADTQTTATSMFAATAPVDGSWPP